LNRLNAKYHIRDQLSTHILRHTKVTELQEQHINPVVIHYLVGHTPNSTMTDNVYTSVSLDFVKSEIEYSKKIIAMQ
jgi:site-specific recombinase XerD